MEISQKLKIKTLHESAILHLGIYPEELKPVSKSLCSHSVIATQLLRASTWNQSK